jgi:hypothetical protein
MCSMYIALHTIFQCYIIITSLHIIPCLVLYLKHNVSEAGLYLHLRVEPSQLGPIYRASLLSSETESSLENLVF